MTATPDRQAVALTDEDREELRFTFRHYRSEYDEGSRAYEVVERVVARHVAARVDQQTVAAVLADVRALRDEWATRPETGSAELWAALDAVLTGEDGASA